jgi:methyl-accepting chemotaxis protein
LQKLYITDNPNPIGKKEFLDFANDSSSFSHLHKKYHPWLRSFLKERDYYDIFLIDMEGDVLYTVFKEPDFGSNF